MITRDLRQAIARAVAAAGYRRAEDPGLRPTGTPGQYAASIALTLGGNPRETAQRLAALLADEPWIDAAEVTGPGYLTITVTAEAFAAAADSVITAGSACATSDALAGTTVPAAPPADPLAAPTWEEARAALAARLAVRLAAAAGATVTEAPAPERFRVPRSARTDCRTGETTTRSEDLKTEPDADLRSPQASAGANGWGTARAVAFAGRDAVLFTLARAIPGKPLRVEPEIIAKHVLGNPAYAVRYAHARAASGVRWAAASSSADTIRIAEAAALLDALSWLPERVATAARRGRPDEFARYLEDLASATVDVLSSASHPGKGGPLGNTPKSGASLAGVVRRESPSLPPGRVQRLTLAMAARTSLAAGLSLLEVSAPDRL